MDSKNFPSHASLGKNLLKIAKEPPYSLCFLDETGATHLLLSERSLLFLALENEAEIFNKFKKIPGGCIITAN